MTTFAMTLRRGTSSAATSAEYVMLNASRSVARRFAVSTDSPNSRPSRTIRSVTLMQRVRLVASWEPYEVGSDSRSKYQWRSRRRDGIVADDNFTDRRGASVAMLKPTEAARLLA